MTAQAPASASAPATRVRSVEAWLGPRLSMALHLLGGPWGLVADVACDHSMLGLGALATGQARRVVANEAALEALDAGVRRSVAMLQRPDAVGAAWREVLGLDAAPADPTWPERHGYQLELGPMRWLLRPGLAHLAEAPPEALMLCGVGGKLVVKILEEARLAWGLRGVQRLVLLPHRDPADVLAWAEAQAWALVDQGLVQHKGRPYPGFAFVPAPVAKES